MYAFYRFVKCQRYDYHSFEFIYWDVSWRSSRELHFEYQEKYSPSWLYIHSETIPKIFINDSQP